MKILAITALVLILALATLLSYADGYQPTGSLNIVNPIIETNVAYQMTGQSVLHYTNGYIYCPTNPTFGLMCSVRNMYTNTATLTNTWGYITNPGIGTNNYVVLGALGSGSNTITIWNTSATNF